MHHEFQRFVERLNESHDPESFRAVMAEAAHVFELPCFAYLRMPRDGRSLAALISSYPTQWTDHYLKQHYERLDPVIQRAQMGTEPFEWGLEANSRPLTASQKTLFDEASMFGIRCGFTIPIQDGRGPVAAVTFASDARRPKFQQMIETNRRVLQLMAIDLHAHARRKLWQDSAINGARLSPRELECLRWAAQGKSAWAIGQILKISRRTAAFHLDNVRAKMGGGKSATGDCSVRRCGKSQAVI